MHRYGEESGRMPFLAALMTSTNLKMTPDTPHDPKGAAGKLKPQLHLLPPIFCTETAAALSDGARKYGEFNWRRTESRINRSTYTSAILRHVMAIQNGEDRCPESGVTHLGHIAANCAILLDAEACGTLEDDRVLATPKCGDPVRIWTGQDAEGKLESLLGGYSAPRPHAGVTQWPLPADNQSLRETIAELGELLRKTTEERDAALAEGEVKWHDPDNVGDPGEGFRFLLEDEKTIPADGELRRGKRWLTSFRCGEKRASSITYRTRQPLPSPAPVWHNPSKVASAGEGFRFLLETEKIVPADGEAWFRREWFASGNRGYERNENVTYRTRQPLPTV